MKYAHRAQRARDIENRRVSPQPFDLDTIITSKEPVDFWELELPNSDRKFFTGVANRCGQSDAIGDCGHVPLDDYQGPLNLTLTTSVPFTNGQTIYVASIFAGGVGIFGGSESFFNSADFGITAPAGTTLQALSGSVYAVAVPEPSIGLLFVVGIALLALRNRRIVSSRARSLA